MCVELRLSYLSVLSVSFFSRHFHRDAYSQFAYYPSCSLLVVRVFSSHSPSNPYHITAEGDKQHRGATSTIVSLSASASLVPVARLSPHLRTLPKPSRSLPCYFTCSSGYSFLHSLPFLCHYLPPTHPKRTILRLRSCLNICLTGLTSKR